MHDPLNEDPAFIGLASASRRSPQGDIACFPSFSPWSCPPETGPTGSNLVHNSPHRTSHGIIGDDSDFIQGKGGLEASTYTVVISDGAEHDSGFRGTKAFWWLASNFGAYAELGLYWFLEAYFGRRAVKLLRPSQLLSRPEPLDTDWLFVGLPTSVHGEHLRNIRFRRLILYDSSDYREIYWTDSDTELLLCHTDICLKTYRRRDSDYPCRVGLLPIKRPPLNNRLNLAIRSAARKRRRGTFPEKSYDVGLSRIQPVPSIPMNDSGG